MTSLAKELKSVQKDNYRAKLTTIVNDHKGIKSDADPANVSSTFSFGFEPSTEVETEVAAADSVKKVRKRKPKKRGNKSASTDAMAADADDIEPTESNPPNLPNALDEHKKTVPVPSSTQIVKPATAINKIHDENTCSSVSTSSNTNNSMKSNKKSTNPAGSGNSKSASTGNSATNSSKSKNKNKIHIKEDDDFALLEERMMELQVEAKEKEIQLKKQLKKDKKESKKEATGKASKGPKFNTTDDPSISDKMKLKVKYGDGK